jgi:hypothetical protein
MFYIPLNNCPKRAIEAERSAEVLIDFHEPRVIESCLL